MLCSRRSQGLPVDELSLLILAVETRVEVLVGCDAKLTELPKQLPRGAVLGRSPWAGHNDHCVKPKLEI